MGRTRLYTKAEGERRQEEGAGEGLGLRHSLIFTLHLSHQRAVVTKPRKALNGSVACLCGGHKLMAHWDPSPALFLNHMIPLCTAGQHQAKEPADLSPSPTPTPGSCSSICSKGQHSLSHCELGGSGQGPVSTGTPAKPLPSLWDSYFFMNCFP